MNKNKKTTQFSTMITYKWDDGIRLHAFKEKVALKEMLELYQNAYIKAIELEKKDKIKVACSGCQTKNYPANMWLVAENNFCCCNCRDKSKH